MNSLLRLRLQVEVKGMEQFAQLKGAIGQMQKQVTAASGGAGKAGAAASASRAAKDQAASASKLYAINKALIGQSSSLNTSKVAQYGVDKKIFAINQGLAKFEAQNAASAARNVEKAAAAAAKLQAQQDRAAASAARAAAAASGGAGKTGVNIFSKLMGLTSEADPNKFFNSWNRSLIGMGRQVQWTGRQLEYNFTLPIKQAGAAIIQMGKTNEEALTRLVKVYGTGTQSALDLSNSTKGLATDSLVAGQNMKQLQTPLEGVQKDLYLTGEAMRLLSDHFGIALDQVADLGARWAATGAQGKQLAQSMRGTMEAMLVGDFTDQEEAFNTLIQIMSAYQVKASDLTKALATINQVENVTAASFTDLAKVVARSGASASAAGVDLQHLTAIAAALVPATGSAESAGNSLKTLFSKLLAPTQDAADVMAQMGINIADVAWVSQNADERLNTMAQSFQNLTQPQQAVVSSFVAGRYQLNRFDLLMKDLVDDTGSYQRALDSLQGGLDENSQVMKQYNAEIKTLLASNPQQMKILVTQLKNMANEVVVYLFPYLIAVLQAIVGIVRKFSELDEGTKKLILLGIAALAAAGPLLRIGGAILQLVGVTGKLITGILTLPVHLAIRFAQAGLKIYQVAGKILGVFKWLVSSAWEAAGAVAAAIGLPLWAVIAIVAAVLAAIVALIYLKTGEMPKPFYTFAMKVKDTFQFIWDFAKAVFGKLPEPVQNAMMAILHIIQNIGKAIYEALQWINPFARHSPSLVESVAAGVDIIAAKYGELAGIGATFRQAANDLEAFKRAAAGATGLADSTKQGKQRSDIAAAAPEVLPAFDQMSGSYNELKVSIDAVQMVMDDQEATVNALQASYDALSTQLDDASDVLDNFKDAAEALKDQLDAANDTIKDLAATPIAGMRAMNEAIWQNEFAQKQLRLEMMRLEDVVGPLDDLESRLADLQGDIEQMRGLQEDLRRSGAGSEITGPLQGQIDALEAQRTAVVAQAQPLQDMQTQLDALGRTAERLDLEKAVRFDPLTHQIENLVDAAKELPFDEIVAGIQEQQRRIIPLTAAYDQATAAVREQQLRVDGLDAARKAMGRTLDVEKDKLDQLKNTYDAMKQVLSDIESAMSDLASAANDAAAAVDELSNAEQQFADAGAGDFESGAFQSPLSDTGGLDQLLEDWKKEFNLDDPFSGLKDQWNGFKKWWADNLAGPAKEMWDGLKETWSSGLAPGVGTAFGAVKDAVAKGIDGLMPLFNGIKSGIKGFWATLTNPAAIAVLTYIWDGIKKPFVEFADIALSYAEKLKKHVLPALQRLADKLSGLPEAVGHIWAALGPIIALVIGAILLMTSNFLRMTGYLLEVLGPAIKGIFGGMAEIMGGIIDTLAGTIGLIIDLINGDWLKAWDDFRLILEGTIEIVKGVFTGLWDALYGLVVTGTIILVGLFIDLGINIVKVIAEAIGAVVGWFAGLLGKILGVLGNVAVWLWDSGWKIVAGLLNGIGGAAVYVWDWFAHLVGTIASFIGDTTTALWNKGWSLIVGLLNGIGAAVGYVWDFFSKVGGYIKGFFVNAGSWLYDIGKSIIQGLMNGIWDMVTAPIDGLGGLLGKVGGFIKEKKGPIDDDRKMLIPHGKAIMEGLMTGIESSLPELNSMLTGVGNMVANVNMGASVEAPVNNQGPKVMVFNGDLVLPNISSGDDADLFIQNLKALAVR